MKLSDILTEISLKPGWLTPTRVSKAQYFACFENAVLKFYPYVGQGDCGMVTVEYQVGASGDDGLWITTTFITNQDLQFGSYTAGIYKSFFRFTGVTIPDGAIINSAYLSFYYSGKVGTPPACTLSAVDEANPSTITGYADGNGRSLTTANIAITGPDSGTWWNSNSIISIIEELLVSNSYKDGAAMMFLVVGSGSGQNRSSQRSYDYAGNTYGPKLHIEYTEAAAGKPAANVIWIG